MKFNQKARIALATIAVVALAGGAFAFKTARTNTPFFTRTNSYAAFGTLYSRTAPFVGTHPTLFLTQLGVTNAVAVSATSTLPGAITLTRVSGTETITIPVWTGSTFAATTTNAE